jgi:hypothetical protein
MEFISSNLHGFLKRTGYNLSIPDKKFLQDSLIGLLRCVHLADKVSTPYHFDRPIKRCDKLALRITQIGWNVLLPGRPKAFHLVVSHQTGQDKPMMLLTNVPVESLKEAKRIVLSYIRRQECEEAIRF